ncbi:hypothetical protein H9P43_002568 [Blastocladiella emersonii ATCC 22665]|nr:hypothetical protein H9P43_002568 [Blastocladiella emersonii ATCC 22665]
MPPLTPTTVAPAADDATSPLLFRRRRRGNGGKGSALSLADTDSAPASTAPSSVSPSPPSSPDLSGSHDELLSLNAAAAADLPRCHHHHHHQSSHIPLPPSPTTSTSSSSTSSRPRRVPSNFCFCHDCVPPTPHRTAATASGGGLTFDNVHDPGSINPAAPLDPDDTTWTAAVLYVLVYLMAFSLRWATVAAGLVVAAAAWAHWFAGAQLPAWAVAGAGVAALELFLSATLVVPHRRALDAFFDRVPPPAYSRADRWFYLTQSVHAFHPFAGPLAEDAGDDGTSAAADQRTLLRVSRPLPSSAGQPFHIVPHIGTFLSGWFFGATPCEIRLDNLKEWFAWAFFNRHLDEMSPPEETELDEMVTYLEDETGVRLARGYNAKVKCIRLNLDAKRVKWRGGLFYAAMTLASRSLLLAFWAAGYTQRTADDGSLILLVPRSLTRKTTSKKPILFLHGLGVSIFPYLPWAAYTAWTTGRPLVFLNVPCVSIQLFPARPPTPASLNAFLQTAWQDLDLPRCTIVGHSLGTSLSAWVIKNAASMRAVVDSAVLLDPVCFGLCFMDVAWNFVYRTPKTWTQLFIRYFAGRDPNVANFLYRHFWWFDNVLYRAQWSVLDTAAGERPQGAAGRVPASMTGDKLAVVLSEYDSIVNSEAVARYLDREGLTGLTVFKGFGHGGFLYHTASWREIVAAIERVAANADAEAAVTVKGEKLGEKPLRRKVSGKRL